MSEFPPLTDELIRRLDVEGPRYTSYPTAPNWTTELDGEVFARHLEAAGREAPDQPLSLYFHLPFCEAMCTYCGCNVVITKDPARADVYIDHLEREMDLALDRLGPRHGVAEIHWGGGTPTFLSEAQIERLFRAITARFEVEPDAAIAIEVDPVVTTRGQIDLLSSLGFNRISMGVQDFSPRVQEAVNRIQTVEETAAMVSYAREKGFGGVNFDLIYGLPRQSEDTWAYTLENVLALRPDRLAMYSFAYIPDKLTHQRKLSADEIPRGPAKLALFRQVYEGLMGAGYEPIGMDHFALPDDELARARRERRLWRNFQGYTVKQASDSLAFGSTGISDLAGCFAQNVRALPRYYAPLTEGRFATERGLALSAEDKRRRAVITQIMCNFWIDLGEEGATHFAPELERLGEHVANGLLEIDGTRLEITPLGKIFVRNVAMVFDTYLSKPGAPKRFSRTV